MCVLSYRAQSRGGTSKKSVFLKYLLAEQHKKSRKNLAESFDFSTIFKKSEMKKLNGARFWKGGSFVPRPPHLVVK